MIQDTYKASLLPTPYDGERGSLRMIAKLLGRNGQPNEITAASVETHAVGSTFTPLPEPVVEGEPNRIVGNNGTGTSLSLRRVGTTPVFVVASGAPVDLPVVASASEWEVKRTDDSNTQVTLDFLQYGTK